MGVNIIWRLLGCKVENSPKRAVLYTPKNTGRRAIYGTDGQARKSSVFQSIYNLKDASNMLIFLQQNQIMDMTGLDEKFSAMLDEQMDIRDNLKPIECRLPVLKKHMEQADIYFKHKGKKKLSEADQILFAAATNYLKDVMNGHTSLPVKAWKSEYAKLTAEHRTLNMRYLKLKDGVKEAEQIRKSVYSILRQEQREQQPRRAQDVER